MVTDFTQAMLSKVLDIFCVGFIGCAVYVLVQPLVGFALIGLWVINGPGSNFIFINPDLSILNP